jgi:hypothetical protein
LTKQKNRRNWEIKKEFLSYALAAVLIFLLTACGGNDTVPQGGSTTPRTDTSVQTSPQDTQTATPTPPTGNQPPVNAKGENYERA